MRANASAPTDGLPKPGEFNAAPIWEPNRRAVATMPTAIKAAMRPYSMLVGPDSGWLPCPKACELPACR